MLVGLTFIAGAGALITGKVLNDREASGLKQFQLDLAAANDRASHADLKRVELQNGVPGAFCTRRDETYWCGRSMGWGRRRSIVLSRL